MTQYSLADPSGGVHSVPALWRGFSLSARRARARFRTTFCNECSQPLRWWNRRVWVIGAERCAHLECWKGQVFLKSYVQLIAEESRVSARADQAEDSNPHATELRELRASARALRETAERLEAQIRYAEVLAARMRTGSASKNGKHS